MIVLTPRVLVKSDSVVAFTKLAAGMLGPSRAEEGCISYNFYNSPLEPTQFVFVEEWETMAHLHAHFETSHFKEFIAAVENLLASPPDMVGYLAEYTSVN